MGEGSLERPLLRRGGGVLPAWGTTEVPLVGGREGGVCDALRRAMSFHAPAAWDYILNPPRRSPFFWGGGARVGDTLHLQLSGTHEHSN